MEIERLENSPENFRRLKVKALSLQSELDEAESRLNDLRDTFLNADNIWPELDLSPTQTLIFSLLMSRAYATKETIHATIDARRLDHREDYSEKDRKLIEAFICKMRARLRPFGIEIKTVWGHGYEMAGEMKARAQALTESGALRARAIAVNSENFVNHSGGYSKARVFSEYAE
jgi:two-component system cell cycle response regulator CtrA